MRAQDKQIQKLSSRTTCEQSITEVFERASE